MSFQTRVIVDERERDSGVPDVLKALGLQVDYRMLEVGDYVVSSDCAVERKAGRDFAKSLYSGRLFDQARRLRQFYSRPVFVAEGDLQLLIGESAKPRAYWGALATLAFQFGLTVFFTANARQTADLIRTLAKRSGLTRAPKGPWVQKKVRRADVQRMQLSLVASLPAIGPKLAERVLGRFGTVRRVFSASVAELCTVKGVGRVKAEKIAALLDREYKPAPKREKHVTLDAS
ncbi:MAG TPA: ERCC4 domain-containing protein [Candidatus Bathyarchaeia archaeon]|nr:ERCC4 domain-containing protein [Candidatus Bathyarchaeia archaeon]